MLAGVRQAREAAGGRAGRGAGGTQTLDACRETHLGRPAMTNMRREEAATAEDGEKRLVQGHGETRRRRVCVVCVLCVCVVCVCVVSVCTHAG